MRERLDSTQLEIYGVNCNNLNEEGFKIQKRKHEDMKTHVNKPSFHMS